MGLEQVDIQNGAENITQAISQSTSEISRQVSSAVWDKVLPIIEILGGILVLYIIYKIIQSITNHLLKKRVKRIDKNVIELNNKIDEVLSILKKKTEAKSKKGKKTK